MFRKMVVAIVASGVFGGMVGALATAAVQSQASPQAIAAAAVRVKDSAADRSLKTISSELAPYRAQLAYMENALFDICSNTQPSGSTLFCAPPPSQSLGARDR